MKPTMYEAKLDEGLLEVLRHPYARTGRFPVMVVATADNLGRLEQLLGNVGQIRFVLQSLNAISAWVPLGAIEHIAQQSWVVELEIAREVEVADA